MIDEILEITSGVSKPFAVSIRFTAMVVLRSKDLLHGGLLRVPVPGLTKIRREKQIKQQSQGGSGGG
jgi:hypothetical protein